MAASLSEGEFHRMQLQLIELRTTNYELEGKNKKLERELTEVSEKVDILDKELGKAKQAINKSKKAKDVEVLIQESDSLQRKLLSQEEEFRLQNQTLMTELALLVSNNEELKKEVATLRGESANSTDNTSQQCESNDELRRLQAENSALQKNLCALQEKYDREVGPAQSKVDKYPAEADIASTESPGEENDTSDSAIADVVDGFSFAVLSSPPSDVSDLLNKLQLEVDTEREEKRLIKHQLDQKQKESKDQLEVLQDELEKANEKLKKKQESYMQLHAEKEQLYKESSVKLEESQAARDRDQKYYKDQIAKLQQEIERGKKEVEQYQMSSDKQTEELRLRVIDLQKQVDASGLVATHQLQEQGAKYLADITVLRDSLAKVTKERDDFFAHLLESHRVRDEAVSEMQAAQTERDTQINAVQEVSKVAEKRKALLDELAIKYQKEYDAHRENIRQMETRHAEEIERLQSEIEEQKKKISELSKQMPVIEGLNKKVTSLEDAKRWLERRLTDVEEQLSSTITVHEQKTEDLVSSHRTEVEELTVKHEEEIRQLKEGAEKTEAAAQKREATLKEELERVKNKANNLKQEIKDTEDEKKLHEKKGMTMLKDLKRQLHAERKRAEKLQLKLQEVLSEDHNKNMEDLFRSPDSDPQTGDASSVSSWGAGASGLGKDSVASGPQSPMSGNNSFVSDTSIGDEYNDLLKRIGVLQQEKWALEEKVNHLEMSNACMAEDILNKTSIIEHYVMESRTGPRPSNSHEDKLSLKKVMDMVNKNSQHTQDMNKKLQSMLEETLTKNMHLQQHLELMSQEIVRLSKLTAQGLSGPPSDKTAKEIRPPTSLALETTTSSSLLSPPPPSSSSPPPIPDTNDNNGSKANLGDETSPVSEENFEMVGSVLHEENAQTLTDIVEPHS